MQNVLQNFETYASHNSLGGVKFLNLDRISGTINRVRKSDDQPL